MYCYDFEITEKNAVGMSKTLVEQISQTGAESSEVRVSKLAGIFAEDMLMSIKEKNPPGAKLDAELMVIRDDAGVRLILRDSGVLFDITEGDGELSSFRNYIISRTITLSEYKSYTIATGYNRNELYLSF